MNRAYAAALEQRISQACYLHIQPHLERYQAEPYLEQCLPLMEPSLFAGFAVQACRDVAALVTAAVREEYRRCTRGLSVVPAAVLGLVVEDGDEDQVYQALVSSIGDFGGALERYAPDLGRFRQVLRQAGPAAWNNGVALGEAAQALAGGFFGRMGAIIAAAAAGMAGGHAVLQQVQAEGERLQQSFGA